MYTLAINITGVNIQYRQRKQNTEKTKMNKSDSVDAIFAALSKAQSSYGTVAKTKRGHVGNFADLADCILATKKPFAENGLGFCQSVVEGMQVETVIYHSSGQHIAGLTPIHVDPIRKPLNSSQMFGIGETYAKRYGFCSLVGLVADDNDADYVKGQATIAEAATGGVLGKEGAAKVLVYARGLSLKDDEVLSICKVLGYESIEDYPSSADAKASLTSEIKRIAPQKN